MLVYELSSCGFGSSCSHEIHLFFCCQGHLKESLENCGFCQKSGSYAYILGGGGERPRYLFHYDVTVEKIDPLNFD